MDSFLLVAMTKWGAYAQEIANSYSFFMAREEATYGHFWMHQN